jgi:Flp pilus assembly protein TadG
MVLSRPRSAPRSGTAAVEFAVLMLFLVPLLLFGMLEIGRMVEVTQILQNAVREGGRQASTGQQSDVRCIQIVQEYLQREGIPIQNANITVVNLGFPGNNGPPDNNPINASDLDRLQIAVTLPVQDIQWLSIHVITGTNYQLTASATWSSMKDHGYPVPAPPSGF